MTCPQTEQLSDFALGKLPEEQSEVLAQHIETCPECSTTIETLDRASDTLVSCLVGQPAPAAAGNDSQYERAAMRVKQIGREPSQSLGAALSEGSAAELANLGQLREYRLLTKLGQGGMGAVYKALHTRLERVVALKVLPAERMRDAAAVARFSREMKAVGRLDHPHIVRAMDAGEVDGQHFLVMEYVQGEDLSDLVARRGPLPVADACELIRQAAIGLQHAHEHGLVHRDIKPSNLMLAVQGSGVRGRESGVEGQESEGSPHSAFRAPHSALLKILDLGLALLDMQPEGGGELTGSGQLMGTVDYMAPEQATDTHRVDIRADIYSLGATLYKLLTGQAPFVGERYPTPISKIMAHATQSVPSLRDKRPEVPAELEAVVAKMLAKTPEERYHAPLELAEALAPFARGADLAALCDANVVVGATGAVDRSRVTTSKLNSSEGSNTSPTETLSPATKPETQSAGSAIPPSRRTWLLAAAAAAAAVLLGVVVIIRSQDGREKLRVALEPGDTLTITDDATKPNDPPSTTLPTQPGSTPKTVSLPPIVPLPRVPVKPLAIVPQAHLPMDAGQPLFNLALTGAPAKLAGLESWTVETRGHRGGVRAVRYRPDGTQLASCGADGTVRLWDVSTGQLVRVLVGALGCVCWSPDGLWLATGGPGGTLSIWESDTGRLAKTIDGLGYAPRSIDWSAGGDFWLRKGRTNHSR